MTVNCRLCSTPLHHVFCDLGSSPLSNSYLQADQLLAGESFYPLTVYVCDNCLLVQLPEFEAPESIFSDYAYFSSYSESWLRHAAQYVEEASAEFDLGPQSLVTEVASNDGYLLKNFVARGVPVRGIEPAANVAAVAEANGVPTLVRFFGTALADELAGSGGQTDLLIANNVLAHVPDLNDFIRGMARLLRPSGVATVEFPHLLRLVEERQFDTIYHEHFSYFSLFTASEAFARHGLTVYDVRQLPTHGGSLRLYVSHKGARPETSRVQKVLQEENRAGLHQLPAYLAFDAAVRRVKRDVLRFLIAAADDGKKVVGYGAPAKGNTLLNYCGARADLVSYTVDRSPHKQGRFLPGSRIPIHPPERIRETRPDYVLILPWNLREEIVAQLEYIREWGGQAFVPIPTIQRVL
jgi:2-polyprenyl-3-methyl-5-hydroxy-6-metoxy-1,4-benzoquinol methylase